MSVADEARETYRQYVQRRRDIEAGKFPWSSLVDFFTDDAVFLDPAWGRTSGRKNLEEFFERSMAGLEDWNFPEEWTIVDGYRVVSFYWNRLPGTREDGRPVQAPGISVLHYAGNGKFSYEMDLLNMAEVGELFRQSSWRPTGEMFPPPEHPDRNPTPPGGGPP
jgi:ketosteroid isomerase-like protein